MPLFSILALFKYLLFYYIPKPKTVSAFHSWVSYQVLPKQWNKSFTCLSGRLSFHSLLLCLFSGPPCPTYSSAVIDKSKHKIYTRFASTFSKEATKRLAGGRKYKCFLNPSNLLVCYIYNVNIHRHSSYDLFPNLELSETKNQTKNTPSA